MKKGNVLILAGLLLITAALSLTGFNIWDNYRAGKAAGAVLGQIAPMLNEDSSQRQKTDGTEHFGSHHNRINNPGDEIEYPDYILDPNKDMPVVEIDGKEYIGVISISSIERKLPVFSEWDYSNLKTAPCRYRGSVYLNNMVICAHNFDVHFGGLSRLNYGDIITFTDTDGNVFLYKVTEIEILDPYAIEEMTDSIWDLTLFTCTIGGAARVTVRCEKTDG